MTTIHTVRQTYCTYIQTGQKDTKDKQNNRQTGRKYVSVCKKLRSKF
jgi:hypothetical protein